MRTSDIFRSARIQKIYHLLTVHRRHVTKRKNLPRKRKIRDVENSGGSLGERAVWVNSYASVQLEHGMVGFRN